MLEFFLMICSAFLGAFTAIYLPFFRQLFLGPKLELFFDRELGCIRKTPIRNGEGQTEGVYCRVLIKNTKPLLARDCRAFLTNIEKKGVDDVFHPTIYIDSIQAQWASRSGQGFQGIDIPKGINQFVDIFSTNKVSNKIEHKIELFPFMYQELFQEHGVFRYSIIVSGNEVKPKSIKFIFHWKGQWDDFEAYLDPDSLLENKNSWCKFRKIIADVWKKGEALWGSR